MPSMIEALSFRSSGDPGLVEPAVDRLRAGDAAPCQVPLAASTPRNADRAPTRYVSKAASYGWRDVAVVDGAPECPRCVSKLQLVLRARHGNDLGRVLELLVERADVLVDLALVQ